MTKFQDAVFNFCTECFGLEESMNKVSRAHRFVEESIELAQASGVSIEDVLIIVGYVYSRPCDNPAKEIGQVMVTLAALSNALNESMNMEAQVELERMWHKIQDIRHKFLTKPVNSPLPGEYPKTQ